MVEVLRHTATVLGVWRHSILSGREVRGWILAVASAVVILIGFRKTVSPVEVAGETTVVVTAVVVEVAWIVATVVVIIV